MSNALLSTRSVPGVCLDVVPPGCCNGRHILISLYVPTTVGPRVVFSKLFRSRPRDKDSESCRQTGSLIPSQADATVAPSTYTFSPQPEPRLNLPASLRPTPSIRSVDHLSATSLVRTACEDASATTGEHGSSCMRSSEAVSAARREDYIKRAARASKNPLRQYAEQGGVEEEAPLGQLMDIVVCRNAVYRAINSVDDLIRRIGGTCRNSYKTGR